MDGALTFPAIGRRKRVALEAVRLRRAVMPRFHEEAMPRIGLYEDRHGAVD